MSSFTNHLLRRGVEELQSSVRNAHDGSKAPSPWSLMIVATTIMLFALGQFAIHYTYAEVIGTLAAVEAPSSTTIVRTPPVESEESENADAPLLPNKEKTDVEQPQGQEVLLIKQRALTSRFRTIKRHLKSRGGRGWRFRGLAIYELNILLLMTIMAPVSVFVRPQSATFFLLETLAITLLTPFELLWNHVVISEPSQKSWYQRMASRSVIKKALFPTFLYVCITQISAQGFIHGCLKLRMDSEVLRSSTTTTTGHQSISQIPLSLILVLFLGLFLFMAVQIPAEIAMIRVRASLLSTEEEPIIPFDRSFDGQVIPTEQGGYGALDFWQAWVGCSMQTRLRVLGVYAKVILLQICWMLFGAAVLFAELRFIFGAEFVNKMSLDLALRV